MKQENYFMQQFTQKVDWLTLIMGREQVAVLMMFITTFLWPLSFVYVSEHKLSLFETNLARGLAIFVTHTIICRMMGIDLDFKSSHDIKGLLIRNSSIFIHQLIYTGMFFVVSTPVNNTIAVSGPLFVFVIDYYINGITINKKQAVGVALGITGVILTVNADYLTSLYDQNYKPQTSFQHYLVEDKKVKLLLSFIALLSNVIWAYGIVSQKNIKHVPGIKISYFLGLEFIFTSSVTYCSGSIQPSDMTTFFGAFLFSGCGIAISQILFISSLNMTKHAGKLTILILNNVVVAGLISFFRYGQSINAYCLVGMILMGYGLYRTIFGKDD